MRLALKLTIAVMLVMAVLLIIHSFLIAQREVNLFEKDMERHANIIGNAMTAMALDILQFGGKARLEEITKNVNEVEPFLHIQLVDLNDMTKNMHNLHITQKELNTLKHGDEIMKKGIGFDNQESLIAYFPVPTDEGYSVFIEIAESLSPMHQYVLSTIWRKVVLFIAIVTLGSLLVLWLGARIVGESVRNMVALTAQVSTGDFSGSVVVRNRNDEMSKLADGLNDMVQKLDIARRHLEEETQRKMEALEQLYHAERLATVGKLASGLAHELGTPLNVVSGRAKMVSAGSLSEQDVMECADIINEQSERMTRIIRQLLDFARERTPAKKPTDVEKLAEKVLKLLRPLASNQKINLNLKLSGPLPILNVDPGQIQQVFSNLIVNAIYAMPNGGDIDIIMSETTATPPPDIGDAPGKYLQIDVKDEGIGISKENLPQIFAPFFSTKDVGKGTGLGLSISHGIVREHKGWITVESEIGKGSVFMIYLPLEKE